jgi:hypothetical protein
MDERYFYLLDGEASRLYVWEGIPDEQTDPLYVITVPAQGSRLFSDGRRLVLTASTNQESPINIYSVDELGPDVTPAVIHKMSRGRQLLNLPGMAITLGDGLAVANISFSQVLIWHDLDDAISGNDPDVILGADSLDDTSPGIGPDTLFYPAALAFDGTYLWVGEFKFSERLLRFKGSG